MRLRVPWGRFCLYVLGISSALFHLCERGLGGVIYWRGNSWENRLLYRREHKTISLTHPVSCKSSYIRQPAGDSLMGSPQNMVLWGEEEKGSECSFRFSGNGTERTLRRRGARGPPLERSSSDAKQPDIQLSGLCLAERTYMVVRPCIEVRH